MRTGEFLERFFKERGNFTVKPNGEADVLCPFPHDKGYENRPSAHVNVQKGIFHCKTCRAEDRFKNGGLSEIDFFAHIYNVTYEEAVKVMSKIGKSTNDKHTWAGAVDLLLQNEPLMTYLAERGITRETVINYELGYQGEGIVYPIYVHGQIVDRRTKNINPTPNEPKIKSLKEAPPLLFPFDHWRNTEGDTFLHAGENDTLLSRQFGFNAVTNTMGEGSFPKIFAGMLRGKRVYICYDCDDAGRKAAYRDAFTLHEHGADVYIIDLELSGTKEDKDFTDFLIKHRKTVEDFRERIAVAKPYTEDDFQTFKNEVYPLVDLWDVTQGRYAGHRYSSRVVMSGKYDIDLEMPSAVEWQCNRPSAESPVCMICPKNGKLGWWTLEEDKLHQVLELVEVTDKQQDDALDKFIQLPPKCPGVKKTVRARKRVQKVILTPDVESEDIMTGFKSVEQYAYLVGDDLSLDDGFRYRVYFRRYAHKLKKQQVWMVIDQVEDSDSGVNAFKMTPDIHTSLLKYYDVPQVAMKERYKRAKNIVGKFAPEQVVNLLDIVYHSPLQFKFAGRKMWGFPEVLIIGESRTGKTSVGLALQRYYGIGNYTLCKGATVAGLMGGADKLQSGGYKLKWGKIPRNHKGLMIMDEMSGMPHEVFSQLTGMRSEKVAILEKIADGRAPAATRLLWVSNPRVGSNKRSRSLYDYPYGTDAVLDLVGSDEDIARFDAVLLLPSGADLTSPLEDREVDYTYQEDYRNMIYWVWSRTADQILWETGVEQYVWHISQELNEKYNTDVKFFGAEAWKKLARIAVACAGATFSADETGENVVVTKAHVDWASQFLVSCYDNDVFRLAEYVQYKRQFFTTTPEINAQVAHFIQNYPLLMQAFRQHSEFSMRQLQALSGLDGLGFNVILSELSKHNLVQMTQNTIMPTRRLRLAMDAYRLNTQTQMQRVEGS